MKSVKRGEIYLYDFGEINGSIQNGIRPVVVIQCDETNSICKTTVIAPITSIIKKEYLPSHIFLNDNFGLHKPSMIMLEQLRTVNQNELIKYIGIIDSEYIINKINYGMKKTFSIWFKPKEKKKEDVRCLCWKCLQDYKDSGEYLVKRKNPYATEKEKCDKCECMGWEYVLIKKRSRK